VQPVPFAPQAPAASTQSVRPPQNGRKIVQSAALQLAAAPDRVDDVAQEVFNVVGGVGGIVDKSSVTATGGLDGYASFQLRVPSASLGRTMSSLSRLSYAHVVSRTDNSQDVNQAFVTAARQLADAQALRTSLLKQLAKASTTSQIDSLKARIKDVENRIAQIQAHQQNLQRQVDYSHIDLTIQASNTGVSQGGGGPFDLGRAAHDALRVLTVGAGVALIALAVFVPIALLGALAWWVAGAFRRRRREQALDLA
jgi:hypothetical protein